MADKTLRHGITIRFTRDERRQLQRIARKKQWSVSLTARTLVERALKLEEFDVGTETVAAK